MAGTVFEIERGRRDGVRARVWRLIGYASVLASCAASLLGCAPVRLIPVAPTQGDEAVVTAPSIEVRANADESQRLWTVPHGFIPVRLSVHNAGQAPIYIELDDIQLRDARASSSAVPPASIQPRQRVSSLGLDPGSPFVAPQIGGNSVFGRSESLILGPPMGTSTPPIVPNEVLDRARYEIVSTAFNGGEIESGQTLTGLVYFRHVPSDGSRVTLRVGVRPTPAKGSPSSVVEIAYAAQT